MALSYPCDGCVVVMVSDASNESHHVLQDEADTQNVAEDVSTEPLGVLS